MILDSTVIRWHATIIEDSERALGRHLTEEEKRFVTFRGGFIALEMIHEEVKSRAGDPPALARYLNAEADAKNGKS